MRSLAAVLTVAGLALAGCQQDAAAPAGSNLIIGTIDIGGTLDSALVGPSGGAVGEPLRFTVTTYGGLCFREAGASVINQGLQMTIIPYDSVLPLPCASGIRALPREVVIVFDRAGDAVLRLQGQSDVGRNPAVVTRVLQIRP